VLCLGLDANLEGEEGDATTDYGSGDKPNLNLPGMQNALLEKVLAKGKPTIVVLLSEAPSSPPRPSTRPTPSSRRSILARRAAGRWHS